MSQTQRAIPSSKNPQSREGPFRNSIHRNTIRLLHLSTQDFNRNDLPELHLQVYCHVGFVAIDKALFSGDPILQREVRLEDTLQVDSSVLSEIDAVTPSLLP